jgi:colanic acid biosynthesis glycosyl transferase WcaI
MRILVWGINYAPEVLGIAPCNVALCEGLVAAGHDVAMLTTFPYYPEWKKREENRGRWAQSFTQGGVQVERVWHYVPARPTALRRIWHELSFVLASALRALSLRRPDAVLVVLPPLALGAVARMVCKIWGCPYVVHVQDLQPEAALALGMLKPGVFAKVLRGLADVAYRGAAFVSAISQEMLDRIGAREVAEQRRVLFPNGIPMEAPREELGVEEREAVRRKWGVVGGEKLLVYSGNMGEKQGLDVLLQGAEPILREGGLRLILCGGGARFESLQRQEADLGCGRLRVVSTLPAQEYWALLRAADGLVISQRPGTSEFFLPSKLLAYLGAGRPILALADTGGNLARWIAEKGVGMVVETRADDVTQLLRRFSQVRVEELSAMGMAAARERETLRWSAIVGGFIERLQSVR